MMPSLTLPPMTPHSLGDNCSNCCTYSTTSRPINSPTARLHGIASDRVGRSLVGLSPLSSKHPWGRRHAGTQRREAGPPECACGWGQHTTCALAYPSQQAGSPTSTCEDAVCRSSDERRHQNEGREGKGGTNKRGAGRDHRLSVSSLVS